MQTLVIGTAGHIDHGKTSLVKALTGVDTDRLAQEKQRGITIELGFARLDLGDGNFASIVDVPGHERFVKTMVAGTSGIDLVMMVVAADEGVMPQTREHLDVCRLLGVEQGLVVVTKIDLVDDADWLEMLQEELQREFAGSFLEGTPLLAVSARTGQGIEELRRQLALLAGNIQSRRLDAPAYLAIDRAFSVKGFGTVVTGTLVSGELAVGDLVDILPDDEGRLRRLKIRTLQVHGQTMERAGAGQRVALNLATVEREALSRGQVAVLAGSLEAGRDFEVTVELVNGARPLGTDSGLLMHVGTARSGARIRLLEGKSLVAGQRAFARVRCQEPLVALPGQHFILRGFTRIPGRGTTLGGGRIITILPPRRRSVSRQELLRELAVLAGGSLPERMQILLRHAGRRGLSLDELAMRLGSGRETLRRALAEAAQAKLSGAASLPSSGGQRGVKQAGATEADAAPAGQVVILDDDFGRVLAAEVLTSLLEKAERLLGEFHAAEPLLPGMPAEQLRSSLGRDIDAKLLRRLLDQGRQTGRLEQQGELVHLAGHRVELDGKHGRLVEDLWKRYQQAGLLPPRLKEVAETLSQPPEQVEKLLRHLVRNERLVHISADLFVSAPALDELRQRLTRHLQEHGQITTQQFKGMVGGSRKHVIPLAEFFDREKLTIRKGEVRVLRSK